MRQQRLLTVLGRFYWHGRRAAIVAQDGLIGARNDFPRGIAADLALQRIYRGMTNDLPSGAVTPIVAAGTPRCRTRAASRSARRARSCSPTRPTTRCTRPIRRTARSRHCSVATIRSRSRSTRSGAEQFTVVIAPEPE